MLNMQTNETNMREVEGTAKIYKGYVDNLNIINNTQERKALSFIILKSSNETKKGYIVNSELIDENNKLYSDGIYKEDGEKLSLKMFELILRVLEKNNAEKEIDEICNIVKCKECAGKNKNSYHYIQIADAVSFDKTPGKFRNPENKSSIIEVDINSTTKIADVKVNFKLLKDSLSGSHHSVMEYKKMVYKTQNRMNKNNIK